MNGLYLCVENHEAKQDVHRVSEVDLKSNLRFHCCLKNCRKSKGYFTPFKWGNAEFEAMYFTTLLNFNEQGKIIKQVDWINYPSTLVDYDNRKNANEWIQR